MFYKRVNPGQAMVVYGRGARKGRPLVVVPPGAGKFVAPFVRSYQMFDTGARKVLLHAEGVRTRDMVEVVLDAVALFRVSEEPAALEAAARSWALRTVAEQTEAVHQVLDAHTRAVASTTGVEDLNRMRDEFSIAVRRSIGPDFGRLGLSLLSFTLKDIRDHDGMWVAMGRKRTAEVKRDAIVGESRARREAIELAAAEDAKAQKARFLADEEIERARIDRDRRIADHKGGRG